MFDKFRGKGRGAISKTVREQLAAGNDGNSLTTTNPPYPKLSAIDWAKLDERVPDLRQKELNVYTNHTNMLKNTYTNSTIAAGPVKDPDPTSGVVSITDMYSKLGETAVAKLEALMNSTEWVVTEMSAHGIEVKHGRFIIYSHERLTDVLYDEVLVATYTSQQANDLDPHANIVRKILLDACDRYLKEISSGE